MALTMVQKLKIRENNRLRTFHAPGDFTKTLGPLPSGVKISTSGKEPDQIHWFVENRSQMEKELSSILQLLRPGVICWIHYPKGSSGIQTDLTRDKGWENLLKENLHWLSLISFNDTWSAFGMRLKTEADETKEAKPVERAIFQYIDPVAKTIRLPEDLEAAFKKAKPERQFFETLSFTNRKEYVEWIVSAKRAETKADRINQSIERLAKGWKNPANR
jgi:hypothetical protein